MTKAVAIHEKPIYSEELFQSFYPMICKMIHQITHKLPHDSDNLERFDDYVQRCRIWLWEHCELYDPHRLSKEGRTCKFSTYMQMVFSSRLGAIRNNKNKKRKNNICVDFSNYHNAENFEDGAGDFMTDISYLMDPGSRVDQHEFHLDMQSKLRVIKEYLSEDKFNIYQDYFIDGDYKTKELAEKYPHLKYNQITKILKELKEVHGKLIGESNVRARKKSVKSRKQVCELIYSRDEDDQSFSEDDVGNATLFTEQYAI